MRALPWWSSGYDSSFQRRGVGSVPNQGTKVPHAGVCGKTRFFLIKKSRRWGVCLRWGRYLAGGSQ